MEATDITSDPRSGKLGMLNEDDDDEFKYSEMAAIGQNENEVSRSESFKIKFPYWRILLFLKSPKLTLSQTLTSTW